MYIYMLSNVRAGSSCRPGDDWVITIGACVASVASDNSYWLAIVSVASDKRVIHIGSVASDNSNDILTTLV